MTKTETFEHKMNEIVNIELTGTERQIAWATTIREDRIFVETRQIERMEQGTTDGLDMSDEWFNHVLECVLLHYTTTTKASDYIDGRNSASLVKWGLKWPNSKNDDGEPMAYKWLTEIIGFWARKFVKNLQDSTITMATDEPETETLYENKTTAYGQVGVAVTKVEWLEMLTKWDVENCETHGSDEYSTPEEIESDFNKAIQTGDIVEL